MARYKIVVKEEYEIEYSVEADSEGEALLLVSSGEGHTVYEDCVFSDVMSCELVEGFFIDDDIIG